MGIILSFQIPSKLVIMLFLLFWELAAHTGQLCRTRAWASSLPRMARVHSQHAGKLGAHHHLKQGPPQANPSLQVAGVLILYTHSLCTSLPQGDFKVLCDPHRGTQTSFLPPEET